MKKVITYGTFDLLHRGHLRLLMRAKELGDYLVVGVTTDDYDKKRGKINVQQSLMERIENVKQTGLADEIIVEEYEGQKIDDIRRMGIDVFAIGSDWKGKFDYLNEYCEVVYLPRTEGVSSSKIRTESSQLKMGFVGGNKTVLEKHVKESKEVNGIEIAGIYFEGIEHNLDVDSNRLKLFKTYEELLEECDAIYLDSKPNSHYDQIKQAIMLGKHVLCESPITLSVKEFEELTILAQKKGVILMEALKTAYATAYNRLLLLIKSGIIGKVVSVDTTCTSLCDITDANYIKTGWSNFCIWGPTAILPVMQILGLNYNEKRIVSSMSQFEGFDKYTVVYFFYKNSIATIKTGAGFKSEGEMIVSGTKGYAIVPAPWWKTDYFEIRFEDQEKNKRYFYPLEGEGIRYELIAFLRAIVTRKSQGYISQELSKGIVQVIEDYYNHNDMMLLDEIIK